MEYDMRNELVKKKMKLSKETLRLLSPDMMAKAHGGQVPPEAELTEAGTCGCPVRTKVAC
ncbi:MAG TPA: hypothetical protein VNM90_00165 [Haliangium sp.]|nr:hypothetical protein [Haliangium sp.]